MTDRKGFIRKALGVLCATAILTALSSCGRQEPTYAPGDIEVVSTPPGAAILFDGRDTGKETPHTFQGLAPNTYTISVEMPDFVPEPKDYTWDLRSLANDTLRFALSQTALTITSEPGGAMIFINGEDSGHVTPATIGGFTPGPVEVALYLENYVVEPATHLVDALAGEVLNVPVETFQLRPQRTVVLEGFGNVNCGPCPELTDNMVALTAMPEFSADRVIFIEYALPFPLLTDPLYLANRTENDERYFYYLVGTAPDLFINGVRLEEELDAVGMKDQVLTDLAVDPGFEIIVAADFASAVIPVSVTLQPRRDVDLSGHYLYVALYEKVVDFNERGLTVGTNGQEVFHHVFRDRSDLMPFVEIPLQAGSPQTFDFSLLRGDWPLDNLAVYAYVQHDGDRSIIQAGSYGESSQAGGNH